MVLALELHALLLLLSLSLLVIIPMISHRRRHGHGRLPPGPIALPIIGHFHLLTPLLHRSFQKLSLRWGPFFSLRLGSVNCVVVSTPELAKELLTTKELFFTSRIENFATYRLTHTSSTAFSAYDAYWKFMHRLTMNNLLGKLPVTGLAPVRTRELCRFLRGLADKSESGKAVNISVELRKLMYAVIFQMICGCSTRSTSTAAANIERSRSEEEWTKVKGGTNIFAKFSLSDFIPILRRLDFQGSWKRTEETFSRFDKLIETVMGEREELRRSKGKEQGVKDGDFLDILLDQLEDPKKDESVQFTRPRVKGVIIDFILASIDTSASTTEWILSELINNPTVHEKARDEIDRVVGKSHLVNESDGPNLPYIQAIVKELFRLRSVSPVITRKCVKECKVGEYIIPENTILFINSWAISRDPHYWENPLEFCPERFLQDHKEASKTTVDIRGQHFELLPFGSGRRMCPGINLVLQMLPIVVAAIIQCFDLKVVDSLLDKRDGHASTLNMEPAPGLTIQRLHHLVCVPVARLSPLTAILEPGLLGVARSST